MSAPRRVFVKIRDFSHDSALQRPKPPSEPRPLLLSRKVQPTSHRLPALQPTNRPVTLSGKRNPLIKSASPSRLQDVSVLRYEEVCNPYELEEGTRGEQRLIKGSFARKVDLRRGSFSKKQILSPRREAVPEAVAQKEPKIVEKREELLPNSPQISSRRNLRMAQISRKFVISKETLEVKSSKHRSYPSEPVPPRQPKPGKSQSVEPVAPYSEWLDSLREVTKVKDFSLQVKPAFVPRRRIKLS